MADRRKLRQAQRERLRNHHAGVALQGRPQSRTSSSSVADVAALELPTSEAQALKLRAFRVDLEARGLVGGLTLEEQAALEPVEVSRVWLESGWTRSLVACLELAPEASAEKLPVQLKRPDEAGRLGGFSFRFLSMMEGMCDQALIRIFGTRAAGALPSSTQAAPARGAVGELLTAPGQGGSKKEG
ncbi:unnamed protein product [Durusdinium trenchii]|uniref:Uncharacterized protein n=1 Tax=Durusdinium trenchii TaxID=1381693 RepID=A0ABP0PFB8_9DINO